MPSYVVSAASTDGAWWNASPAGTGERTPTSGTPVRITIFTAILVSVIAALFPLSEIAALANAGTDFALGTAGADPDLETLAELPLLLLEQLALLAEALLELVVAQPEFVELGVLPEHHRPGEDAEDDQDYRDHLADGCLDAADDVFFLHQAEVVDALIGFPQRIAVMTGLGLAPVGVHEWFGDFAYATWPWAEAIEHWWIDGGVAHEREVRIGPRNPRQTRLACQKSGSGCSATPHPRKLALLARSSSKAFSAITIRLRCDD